MMPNMQNFYPAWLNPSYYQNIPHNEGKNQFYALKTTKASTFVISVNWAQLAQQWMTMRAVEPRFVVPPMQMQQFQLQNQIHHQMAPHSFPPHQQHPHSQSHQQTAPPPLPPMEDLPPPPPPSTAGPSTRPTPLFPAFESEIFIFNHSVINKTNFQLLRLVFNVDLVLIKISANFRRHRTFTKGNKVYCRRRPNTGSLRLYPSSSSSRRWIIQISADLLCLDLTSQRSSSISIRTDLYSLVSRIYPRKIILTFPVHSPINIRAVSRMILSLE